MWSKGVYPRCHTSRMIEGVNDFFLRQHFRPRPPRNKCLPELIDSNKKEMACNFTNPFFSLSSSIPVRVMTLRAYNISLF